MKNPAFDRVEFFLTRSIYAALITYFFVAFLPFPTEIETGLDPSWKYAISRAAIENLVFGKDIIFTYGSLGYLIDGSSLPQNFFLIVAFRTLVHLALFVVAIIKIRSLETNLEKAAIVLSLLLPYLTNFSSDYKILVIVLILLSFNGYRGKFHRLWFIGLGILSGFCLLTKFTLGVYVLGVATLLLVGEMWRSLHLSPENSKLEIISSGVDLANLFLSAISTAFILLSPIYYALNFGKVFACGSLATAAFLIQKYFYCQTLANPDKKIRKAVWIENFRKKRIGWIIFYCIYTSCLMGAIASASPSLPDYIKNSLELSSGYSSAMSLVGSQRVLLLALSELGFISIILFSVVRADGLGFALALVFSLFLSFKHGFVRQDQHIFNFAMLTPTVTALCLPKVQKVSIKRISYLVHLYVLVIFLVFVWEGLETEPIRLLFPNQVATNIRYLIHPAILQSELEKISAANLADVKLPEAVRTVVGDKPVDIIPWEISLVEANKLNWQPRPIFQSYSAFTDRLDTINFDSLSKGDRAYIFYNFISIDSRHPFFDEPKTFAYVFCNYEPALAISQPVSMPHLANLIILEKRRSSRCLPNIPGDNLLMHWDTWQSVSSHATSVIQASIKFKYSLFGKLYKTLFRAAPVIMQVKYIDGSEKSYRIIPENSGNGVIVSHLPKNTAAAQSFLQGQLSDRVASFSFHADFPALYSKEIEIDLSLYSLPGDRK